MCINRSPNTHHLLAQFAALTEEEKLKVALGRAYGEPLELEEGVSLSKIQGMGRRARVGESHGISVTALHDLKCFVRDHEAHKLPVREMKPLVAYAVQPEDEFLEQHDICGMRLGITVALLSRGNHFCPCCTTLRHSVQPGLTCRSWRSITTASGS